MKRIKKTFPRSVAKFIREKKAGIRRTIEDREEQERQIKALYDRFLVFVKSNHLNKAW